MPKGHFLFRKKVGAFPTKPPAWWKEGDTFFETLESAAFDMAWRPFRTEHGPTIAAATFLAVENNTFYDRDTELIKQFLLEQAAAEQRR